MRVLLYYIENKALFETIIWDDKVNKNKVLSYCKAWRYETIKNNKKVVILYVKLTNLPSF